MKVLLRSGVVKSARWSRAFSTTSTRHELRDVSELPPRIQPSFKETRHLDLLSLKWPVSPRNVLLVKKRLDPAVDEAFLEYIKHIQTEYPDVAIVLEPDTAEEIHEDAVSPVYTLLKKRGSKTSVLTEKVDLASTLGGDGTILHAASLFSQCPTVPPVLPFSMGTLGFLGEWKFSEYKRAFREAYVSVEASNWNDSELEDTVFFRDEAAPGSRPLVERRPSGPAGWSTIRGKFMGHSRTAKILLRNRLKVGIFAPDGQPLTDVTPLSSGQDMFAMNEVILHRGQEPHLAIVDVFVGGRYLTEANADGMIVSTPTGSTAYSLSSGGSIVHPLVPALLLTPICPRSLSFRPLILPANTPITLRLSEKNRNRKVDVSIDGQLQSQGLSVGMELRVRAEDIKDAQGQWVGGVPSIVRAHPSKDMGSEESWVGGLNGLLKFNYPMGEE